MAAAAVVMDCTNWDEDVYREAIIGHREALCRTVFRTAFAPKLNQNQNHVTTDDFIVAASSDGSISSYSISSCIEQGFQNSRNHTNSLAVEPHCLIQGHDGPAYDVKFFGSSEDSLLLSCGDDGHIRGWKWKGISDSELPTEGSNLESVIDLVNPQHRGPWGALSPIPENNAIAVDFQGGSIFTATGDSCAYGWDLEKCKVKTVFKGHSNYLHCIVARTSYDQIITGSEDGTVRIWDCKSGKCIQEVVPIKDKHYGESSPYVSCIALDESQNWLACGSGRSLSVWNLAAGACVSRTNTRYSLQDVLFDRNEIVAVGAEPLITRFNMSGDKVSQIQCVPQSVFSVSLRTSGVMAVSGYGALVDVISEFGSHLCTFRCRGQ